MDYAILADEEPDRLIELYRHLFYTSVDLDFLKAYQQNVYKSRIASSPRVAIDLAEDFEQFIKRKSSWKYIDEIEKIQAHILSEKAIAIREVCAKNEVIARVKPLADKMFEIGEKHGDYSIIGLAHACLTDAYYIYGMRRDAIDEAYKGVKILSDSKEVKDLDNRLLMTRTLLVCLSLVDERETFIEESAEAMKLIKSGQFAQAEVVCTLLEGMSTGQGNLKMNQSLDTLELAWAYYNQALRENADTPQFRYIQLGRGGLQSALKLGTDDIKEFKAKAVQARYFAQENGYARYIEQLDLLCKKCA